MNLRMFTNINRNLSWAIVEFAGGARHETCNRSMLLQMFHNAADSVNSASPKGFKLWQSYSDSYLPSR